jgi:hypothetical protein
MYYYFYDEITGKIVSENYGTEPVISEGEWVGFSYLSSENSKELGHYKVNLDTLEIVFDQNLKDTQVGKEVRYERDALLVGLVDPLVTNPLRWNALTDAKQAEWTQYRTDLLDIPEQSGFPNSVNWPTQPT